MLSGAVLALVIAQVIGRRSARGPPEFATDGPGITAAGDAWTLDQLLGQARAGEVKAISALTRADGPGRQSTAPPSSR